MNLKKKYDTWTSIFPYAAILAIIFIFNILAIWGLDGLIIDDQGYYYLLYDKSISDLTFSRNIFHSLFTLGIIKIASYTSVIFARLLILFLLSIPSAFLIFYFSHHHYKIEKYTAVAISVLPFILPNEILVPTYLAGSYMLLAVMFGLISIYFILKFSRASTFSTSSFILAAVFYYITTESSELTAVMLPVFLFLLFIFRKISLKNILLGSLLSAIAIRKAFLVINNPHAKINSVGNELSASEIKNRIIHFMDYINPLHGLPEVGILNIIIIGIILSGAIIVIVNHKRLEDILLRKSNESRQKSKYFYFAYYFFFPGAWLVLSAMPFLFYSQLFNSRYFIMAAIALSFLFFISISIIYGFIKNPKIPLVVILFMIISLAGINRQRNFMLQYEPLEKQFHYLEQTLKKYDLPPDAQVVVTVPDNFRLMVGKGIIIKSTGTFQYILNRRDVSGQIMKEKCFYDPFRIYNRPYKYPDMDIDTARNTILLRGFNEDPGHDRRLYYALRWADHESKDSPWTIFQFDAQGQKTNLVSGTGYSNYESAADSLAVIGIKREDIMFGGFPARSDSLRLRL
jgi:hypothetical protein